MPVSVEFLKALIERELATVSDARVTAHIRRLLVEPHPILFSWDYGEPGQQYPCWMVLNDARSDGEIAYCEYGFGPRTPWGLVDSRREHRTMGMDSGWFMTFLDGFFESVACVELPIWRVFRHEPDGTRTPLTSEGEWRATWICVDNLRSSDPTKRYDCGHSVNYGR
jgi:hypothetical protein